MLVIGLTGGIGSGKSTVADLFLQKGIQVIDADLVAREVVAPGEPALQSIAEHFGADIINNNGELQRGVLRKLIFAQPEERDWLEKLLHPIINSIIKQRISDCGPPYCILMSPLLLETAQKNLVDRILVVDVERNTQLERTLARDSGSRETIEAIIDAQISKESRLRAADDLIRNDGTTVELIPQVDRLHDAYLNLAQNQK